MFKKLLFFALLLFNLVINAQSEWQYLPTFPDNSSRVDDVFFLNPNLGWSCSGGGKICKTTNGGQTWTVQYNSNKYFRCIEFINENIGFAGTLDQIFLKTTNGGTTWTDIAGSISPKPNAICGIDIVDSLHIYAVGEWDSPAFFLKSIDGGFTWENKNMSAFANALVDIKFTSIDTGYVVGKDNLGGKVLYTTDGGDTWTEKINTNTAGEYVWKIQEVTKEVWVGSVEAWSNDGKIVKSTDGGETWVSLPAPVGNMQGIGFITPNKGWIGGYINGIYETLDGGLSWDYKDFGSTFNRFYVIDSTLVYASGASVYKYSNPNVSAISEPKSQQKDVFDFKITPNPANDKIIVSFDLPHNDIVRISVVSLAGVELKNIFTGRLSAGKHQLDLNISLSTGNYLLGMQRNFGMLTKPFAVIR
jgi:photosystem II stability/assembly factor-like uncharacterized protein